MATHHSPIAVEVRATLAVAAPLAGANLAQMAMSLTNTVIVGHLGAAPLAAAGLGAALYISLLLRCQGVLTAVAPLAAHAIGAEDHPTAGRVAGAGLIIAAVLAAPVIAILTVIPGLLAALGYEPSLAAEIGHFMRAIRWGAPAFLGYSVLRFLLVAAFRTRIVMVIPLIAIPLNAALNWVLVFGHFGMPALGSAGSGYATAIVQWLMLLCFAGYIVTMPGQIPVRLAVRVLAEIPRILRLGLPISALIGLETGLFVTTGILMGLLGADALGAHQLVFNVAGLSFMVPLGLGQAATVRVAFQLGLGAPAAARRAGFVAVALGAGFMAMTAVLLWAAPRTLAGAYLDLADPANDGIVAMAVQLFLIAALFQVFDGVQVIAAGALRGYRDTAVPMLIAAVGYWAVGFAGGWLLAFPLGFGAVGLWLGLALGLAVVAVSLTVRLHFRARSQLRTAEAILTAASEASA
jgi:multidrug resistance protein, MATE family